MNRWMGREWQRGGVIDAACESERKCDCGDKCRSLESGCSGVKKVSADVGTRNVMTRRCVGKLGGGTGNIFRSVWDNWSASFSWSVCRRSFGHTQRAGEEEEGRRKRGFGPWAGLVPIRPEARGRFVCTARTSQRRTEAAWCCSSQPGRHGGSISCSASLSCPSCPRPLTASLHYTHPLWNKVQMGLLNCLRMFSVYVLFMRAVLRVPVGALGPTVLGTEPCDWHVIYMWT